MRSESWPKTDVISFKTNSSIHSITLSSSPQLYYCSYHWTKATKAHHSSFLLPQITVVRPVKRSRSSSPDKASKNRPNPSRHPPPPIMPPRKRSSAAAAAAAAATSRSDSTTSSNSIDSIPQPPARNRKASVPVTPAIKKESVLAPLPTNDLPAFLRFPLCLLLNLSMSALFYSLAAEFQAGDLSSASKSLNEWWQVGGLVFCKALEIAMGWWGRFDGTNHWKPHRVLRDSERVEKMEKGQGSR